MEIRKKEACGDSINEKIEAQKMAIQLNYELYRSEVKRGDDIDLKTSWYLISLIAFCTLMFYMFSKYPPVSNLCTSLLIVATLCSVTAILFCLMTLKPITVYKMPIESDWKLSLQNDCILKIYREMMKEIDTQKCKYHKYGLYCYFASVSMSTITIMIILLGGN